MPLLSISLCSSDDAAAAAADAAASQWPLHEIMRHRHDAHYTLLLDEVQPATNASTINVAF